MNVLYKAEDCKPCECAEMMMKKLCAGDFEKKMITGDLAVKREVGKLVLEGRVSGKQVPILMTAEGEVYEGFDGVLTYVQKNLRYD